MSTIQRFLEKEALLKGQQRYHHRQMGSGEGGGKGSQPGPPPTPIPPPATRGPCSPQTSPNEDTQPEDLPKELQTAMNTLQNPETTLPSALSALWGMLHLHLRTTQQNTKTQKSIENIEKTIKNTTQNNPKNPQKTWAQTAAPSVDSTLPRPQAPIQSHVVKITIKDPKERAEITKIPYKTVVEKIGQPGIVGVKRLDSGDLYIYTNQAQTQASLKANTTWAQKLAPSAQVAQEQFQVLIHGIPILQEEINNKEYISLLQKDNQTLHPGLRLSQAHWLKSPKAREGKSHSSVVIYTETKEMAEQICQRGFVNNFTILIAEPHSPHHRITQCFNCSAYGHVAVHCKNSNKCGNCAGDHYTKDCKSRTQKCANCNGSHPSWSMTCKIKQAAKAKVAGIRAAWGLKATPTQSPIDRGQAKQAEKGWTLAQNGKRKADSPQRGRPMEAPSKAKEQTERRPPGRPKIFASSQPDLGQSQLSLTGPLSLQPRMEEDDQMEDITASRNTPKGNTITPHDE